MGLRELWSGRAASNTPNDPSGPSARDTRDHENDPADPADTADAADPDDEDERRRLSLFDLIGLSAGGVLGSGWLFAAVRANDAAGSDAKWSWLIGGVLMLIIAAVMVELCTAAPKTGSLIFLPLQSSGPLVAIMVASGLWIFYAINAASEAAAMTRGLSSWVGGLSRSGSDSPSQSTLTGTGLLWATAFMVLIVALNMLAQRVLLRINSLLTLWKILVPVLVVVLLIASGVDGDHATDQGGTDYGSGIGAALAAVVGSGVSFSYTGFQAPLDFAGNVRRRGLMGETARLRLAVYGTVVGSMILYFLLQVVFFRHDEQWNPGNSDSPYTQFALALSLGWLTVLLRVNALLSPMGSGVVFAHALTREVAALSRAHLTHRGLQTARNASIKLRGRRYDVYWMVLLVDLAIGWVALMVTGGNWGTLGSISGVVTLIVYTMPGVVLVALGSRLVPHSPGRRRVHSALAHVSFVSIALIAYWAGWANVWKGMTAFASGTVLLLVLPVLARWDLPLVGRLLRRYDAKEHASRLRKVRREPDANAAVALAGYLTVLTLLTMPGVVAHVPRTYGSVVVVVVALVTFHLLVRWSRQYMKKVPPVLPVPVPAARTAARATAGPAGPAGTTAGTG